MIRLHRVEHLYHLRSYLSSDLTLIMSGTVLKHLLRTVKPGGTPLNSAELEPNFTAY